MRFRVLACDYDGTIAKDGLLDAATIAALERVGASGRKLLLVTGREVDDLLRTCPRVDLFDWVVAENGALLYKPSTREEKLLGPPAPESLVALLKKRNVSPMSVGRVIVATWEPYETVVLEAIRELGLELQVIFNKGAVMVLPASVNKRSGLDAALDRLGLSVHNCVGVGDAENDHAFLSACECSVAVANALPAVKETADWVTSDHHGAGVAELIDCLLADDLASLEPRLLRHHVPLGTFEGGERFAIPPYGRVVLVAGSSGSGKSTAATALLEQILERGYQVCVVDPEGDYENVEGAVVAGTSEQPPEIEQVTQILARPQSQAVVNLVGVPLGDRPSFFIKLLSRLQEQRASNGRPHWIIVDEAHHVLDDSFEPARLAQPNALGSLVLITIEPGRLQKALLERVDVGIFVGPQAAESLAVFAEASGRAKPRCADSPQQPGEVLVWDVNDAQASRVSVIPPRLSRKRHRRKYARGELGPERSFYFRGPEDKLNLRAQNLIVFNQIAEGVDDETWLFHLKARGYSGWVREAIKDDDLAREIEVVERNAELTPIASRRAIRELIEQRYTLPE